MTDSYAKQNYNNFDEILKLNEFGVKKLCYFNFWLIVIWFYKFIWRIGSSSSHCETESVYKLDSVFYSYTCLWKCSPHIAVNQWLLVNLEYLSLCVDVLFHITGVIVWVLEYPPSNPDIWWVIIKFFYVFQSSINFLLWSEMFFTFGFVSLSSRYFERMHVLLTCCFSFLLV